MSTFDTSSENLAKERQSVLDVGQRNQVESVQAELRRNNELLTTLRRENKELQQALTQTQRGQSNVTMEDHYEKEEELLHNKVAVLKRSINAVKAKNTELTKEIERTQEETRVVQQEGGEGLDEGSPIAQKIRALENRLDKCLVKHNEVCAIRQTYETLLERLQLEQGGFDTQLSSTEKALQQAEKELGDLTAVGNTAAKERDAAKMEVANLKNKLLQDRKTQRKTTDEKRSFVQEKRDALERKNQLLLQKMAQQEDRHSRAMAAAAGQQQKKRQNRSGASSVALRPEETERVETLKEQYLRLRDLTVAGNVAEVIKKVQERRENHQNLEQSMEQLKAAIEAQKKNKNTLQKNWGTANYKAGGAMVSARTTRQARDDRRRVGEEHEDDDNHNNNTTVNPILDTTRDYRLLPERPREEGQVVEEFRQHLIDRDARLKEMQGTHDKSSPSSWPTARSAYSTWPTSSPSATTSWTNKTITVIIIINERKLLSIGVSPTLAAATTTSDLLRSCEAKLSILQEELSEEELAEAANIATSSRIAMPETNVRVPALAKKLYTNTIHEEEDDDSEDDTGATGGKKKGNNNNNTKYGNLEDFPDNEIHSRYELKMMSQATVEREEKKAKKLLQQRRKEETM
ncbi:axonemal dynein intermediate chain protein [Angomonas deanei]|uniref:Uncharacterized protein n=1 Tax=Angomonas deanei TaxID=59799 RepID=A0A7G2CRA4_9TRYP|nr:axonemal dynein intermediate chain protein [Angomonas deanei]CAD2221909.1 hypothetical protein, conserved [Angomonas deanei]|eukprot:EPY29214.1 axonemal dynein intermediate chain protein [Angomonas deanei]